MNELETNRQSAQETLRDNVTPQTDAQLCASQFFEFGQLLAEIPSLLRSVTDVGRSGQDRAQLIASLLEGKALQPVVATCQTIASQHWNNAQSVSKLTEQMGVYCLLYHASLNGEIQQVERELFAVTNLLREQRQLRIELSELGAADQDRRVRLIGSLLEGKILPTSLQLVQHAVTVSEHGRLIQTLRKYQRVGAALHGAQVVAVATAQPLNSSQRQRLQTLMEQKLGTDVTLAVTVDPRLIGGLRVRYGSRSADATIRSEIAEVKRSLAKL